MSKMLSSRLTQLKIIHLWIYLWTAIHVESDIILQTENFTTAKDVIHQIVSHFEKYELPTEQNNSKSHSLSLLLDIAHIYDMSEQDFSFKINYHLRLSWFDARVMFRPFVENNQLVEFLMIPVELFDKGEVLFLGYLFLLHFFLA